MQTLDGLVLGLIAPAVFFLVLAMALSSLGLVAFVFATLAAFAAQTLSLFAIPHASARLLSRPTSEQRMW